MDIALNWDFADAFVRDDQTVLAARLASLEMGVDAVSPGVGATLQVLARALGARAVFEVGTGCGVSGLYLLRGMPDGVLTSVDSEGEFLRIARATFEGAGLLQRTRLMSSRALDLMPRMSSGAYDMVVLDGDVEELPYYAVHAARMLRRGGVMAIVRALSGHVADPTARGGKATALRETTRMLGDSEQFFSALLPVADGLMLSVRA